MTAPLPASRTRLCVVTTHPIQYIAPWFRQLASHASVDLHVVYLRQLDRAAQGTGFGTSFAWDVPLLDGYSSETLHLPAGARPGFAATARLWRAIAASGAQVVMVTGWNEPLLIVAQLVTRMQRRALLVRGESNAIRARSLPVRVAHRLLAMLPTAYLSIGRSNRRFYEEMGVAPTRIHPGVYFVENERMLAMRREHAAERPALRAERGFGDDDFVVMFCGKHVPFKRPMWLLDAVAVLRSKQLPVKALYAGSGELTATLKAHAIAIGVPAHFEGFLNQTELWRAYLAADAFVLPSDNGETWGLVTNEAMLFGLPVVVSTEVGCAEDLVVPGETGYVFAGGPDALAEQLATLARDRAQAQRMGAAACERVTRTYSPEAATAGLLLALQSLRAKHG